MGLRNISDKSEIFEISEGFTHAGKFHADDVFSAALLKIIVPSMKISRGLRVPENFSGIAFDIGRGQFDHHQEDARKKSEDEKYAAFGLLWEMFGTLLLEEEQSEKFKERLVNPIDHTDTTGEPNDLSFAISVMNPTWDQPESERDKAFFNAVEIAEKIIKSHIDTIKAEYRAKSVIEALIKEQSDARILVIGDYVPWKQAVCGGENDFVYVVYKSARGGYNVECVTETPESPEPIKRMPEKWRGVSEDEIEEVSGIKGLRFCHPAGFLAAADTLEHAMSVANAALAQ